MSTLFYDRLLYPPIRLGARILCALYFRVRILKARRLPRRGPLILVANHSSLLDGIIIHGASWRPLRFLLASEWRNIWILRPLFTLMGVIPVYRERRNPGIIDEALAALDKGDVVAIFPEGGIQENGALGPFRSGAARLALVSGAPVFPCAILGAREALPWPKVIPRPRRLTLRCGEPLRFERVNGSQVPPEILAAANERIRAAVLDLLHTDP